MKETRRIICVFCRGSGRHPFYFSPPCPVCNGKGENKIVGEVQTCQHCQGSGCKSGTTLTCWYCGGLGVVAGGDHSGRVHSATPGVIDKNAIKKLVEETLKKYQRKGSGIARGEETAIIKRVPVSGVLREEGGNESLCGTYQWG